MIHPEQKTLRRKTRPVAMLTITAALTLAGSMVAGSGAWANSDNALDTQHRHTMQPQGDYAYAPEQLQREETLRMHYPQQQRDASLRYYSGGIGAEEQRQIKAMELDYPVKLTFADKNGAYLADIRVQLRDKTGEQVLSLITDGPVLLLDVEPGQYTLTADDGKSIKTQPLHVSAKHRSYTLHFDAGTPRHHPYQPG